MTEPLKTAALCEVHRRHTPASHINDRHHVWPLGKGGPDIPENIITVCPTGHRNIHHLLESFIAHKGEVPTLKLRTYTRGERAAAKLGWQRFSQHSM